MNKTTKERLLEFLSYLNTGQNAFEKSVGWSNGYINNIKSSIGSDKLVMLINEYPLLDIDWLLTGEGEMLKPSAGPPSEAPRSKIPLYGAYSVGGTSVAAPSDAITAPTEWIDAGDWFRDATAAMHHYGDSMIEYPSGCILALKEINDKQLIIWGKNYVIETDEYRITKRLQRSSNPDYIVAYSSNEDTYADGTLIHQPIDIPKSSIRRLAVVLGCVVKEHTSARLYPIHQG